MRLEQTLKAIVVMHGCLTVYVIKRAYVAETCNQYQTCWDNL